MDFFTWGMLIILIEVFIIGIIRAYKNGAWTETDTDRSMVILSASVLIFSIGLAMESSNPGIPYTGPGSQREIYIIPHTKTD